MRSPLATLAYDTPSKTTRWYAQIDRIILHHLVMTSLSEAIDLIANARKEVSYTYLADDLNTVSMLDEEWSAFSVANQLVDRRAIAIAAVNETLAPDYRVSAATHERIAQLVAELCKRHGIPCDAEHIIGHGSLAESGQSYATACPGGLNVAWVIARAAAILNGPKETPKPITLEDLMAFKAIVLRSTADKNKNVALDFETGFKTSWDSDDARYNNTMADFLTPKGSTLTVTPGHFAKLIADFDAFFADSAE